VGTSAKRRLPRGRAIAIGVGLALVLAAPALAQEPPSAVNQYAELVPNASGPNAPTPEKETQAPLPPKAADALANAPEETAAALEEVATSSRYGAPPSPSPPVARDREQADVPAGVSVSSALGSTIAAASSTDDRQLVGTGIALLLVTAGAVLLAVRRVRTTD